MSTPIVATGAAALGFYVWLRRWQQCGYAGVIDLPAPLETHARTEQPPNTWLETVYLFKEALRFMYQETFGRWHAIDLFFGLAYLSRRPMDVYPAADIAAAGRPLHDTQMQPQAAQELITQLQEVKRYMLYCQGLKHHKPELQLKHWRITTGLEAHDVIKHSPVAGLLRPAYVIFRDRRSDSIILCVRGTHSRSDMFTSLTGTVKPHHVVTPEGVSLGYSHLGMLAAARWLLGQTKASLIQALEEHPGFQLRIVGHSMGGGTAAMLTMMMREKVPELSGATAWAIACPACMTLDLAASCAPFVTTIVHGTDIVPTFSSGAIDRLRDEVTQSSWFAEFQGDVQQRLSANFGASLRALRLGPAGEWTRRNIISTAATSFTSCYSRAPRSCYSRRSRAALSAPAAAASMDHESPPVSPHAVATPQHRSSWGFHILSSRHNRQQQPATSSSHVQQDGSLDAAAAADAEEAALLAGEQQRTSPFHWLRSMGGRGRRPGYAAAARSSGGGSSSFSRRSSESAGAQPERMPASAEAALVEHALQACLLAADSGQLDPTGLPPPSAAGWAAAGQPAGRQSLNGQAAPPAVAFAASSSTAAGRGTSLANSFVKAASKVVLRTKRPAAPGKKDDDASLQPPLQQGRFEPGWQQQQSQSQSQAAAPNTSSAAGGGSSAGPSSMQLPVSTGATAGSEHAGVAASAAGLDGSEGAGGADDPAAAASSAGKPLPNSLRIRRGWAWGSVLGTGPGDSGWATNSDPDRRGSLGGGRRVVQYLGQTVGHTGRLVVETTGQLLKSSNVLFQACTVPAEHQAAAAAAAAAAGHSAGLQDGPALQGGAPAAAPQHSQQHLHATGGRAAAPSSTGIVVAPSSTGMERGAGPLADGPFVAALAASLTGAAGRGGGEEGDDGGPSDSDSDPDLQDDEGDGQDASAFALLDQPGLRGNISALVAAVSADASAGAQGVARAREEEDRAAERLLQDMGAGASEPDMQRLALQHQHARADPANRVVGSLTGGAAGASRLQGGSQAAPANGSLRRESPMYPGSPGGQEAAPGSADGSTSGRDRAAERLARRRMYPAGRVLHLMPRSACPQGPGADAPTDAAADADASGGGLSGGARKLPPLTSALGSVGLGDEYVLLEVPDAEVYGRVKLCPAMVRDHFIPSYLRALESVLGQLQRVAAAAPAPGTHAAQP